MQDKLDDAVVLQLAHTDDFGYSRQDDPKNRAAQNVIHDDGLQKGSSDDLPGHPPE